jgi:hypothetical protein
MQAIAYSRYGSPEVLGTVTFPGPIRNPVKCWSGSAPPP